MKMQCYKEMEKIANKMFLNDPMTIWAGNEGTEKANGVILYNHCGLDYLRNILAPDGYKVYALRENDDLDGDPATIENTDVMVNFFGYFVTKTDLDWMFKEREFVEICTWDYDPW